CLVLFWRLGEPASRDAALTTAAIDAALDIRPVLLLPLAAVILLALFGLPLSPAAMETNPTDGRQYLTQHFERARFEYHPENIGTPYVVLLGLLGRESTGIR
ncbi:MAG TPA: hypothetical protein PKC19_22950, partial [Roseiflexaceae bacterium]|nr:hypothetical protein [Roseiflexaceae bacterium]